jgi:hypothetical protein
VRCKDFFLFLRFFCFGVFGTVFEIGFWGGIVKKITIHLKSFGAIKSKKNNVTPPQNRKSKKYNKIIDFKF